MAGEYIEFHNNAQPALNETNVNRMQQLIRQDIQGAVSGDTLPVGAIIPFGSDTLPINWLLCDGSAISRAEYSQLFNTIGTTFGQGDGFTTFNLPDLRDRVPIGKDVNDTDFNVLGKTSGERTHILTVGEMAEHTHTIAQGRTNLWAENEGYGSINVGSTTGANRANIIGAQTDSVGEGEAFNITQPSIATNYIIKAAQSAGIVATVIDNLTSTSTTDALSANQGKAIKELLEGTVIYENSEGITTGNIVLSESITNYKRLVFYSPDGQWLGEHLIDGITSIKLQQFDQGNENTMIRIARVNIANNTTLTFYSNVPSYYNGSSWSRNSTSYVTLGKVVGYKY